MSNVYELLNKWIAELSLEIEKAKVDQNFKKIKDLRILQDDLKNLKEKQSKKDLG